jgi:hypothetical protein
VLELQPTIELRMLFVSPAAKRGLRYLEIEVLRRHGYRATAGDELHHRLLYLLSAVALLPVTTHNLRTPR